ncbi:808_t:CDS:1 [Racocetra fulgida]|uniref:808_t:CDS:1 n=1 Tax=Racocetra fulgida TaxID=60492 RepID=A0A9N8VH58_9GLOM|nr:808_t:CDS:1 [Racocetra fulgida]
MEALKNKIKSSQEALNYLLQNEPNKEAKIVRLETQIKILEEVENQLREQVKEEREIHQDSMKAMDNFYQQNPPHENIRLKNILQQFEEKYLKLNRENKQKEQKIKKLESTIETAEKIIENECQPKETKERGTQTELTGEKLAKQQKENQELKEQIKNLTLKK